MKHLGMTRHFVPYLLQLALVLPTLVTLTGCSVRNGQTVPNAPSALNDNAVAIPPSSIGAPSLFIGPSADLSHHIMLRAGEAHITQIGNTLSIIFDRATLSSHLPNNSIQTWSGAMRLNLNPAIAKDIKTVRAHFRYSLLKEVGTRALLLIDINGKYIVEEYSFDQVVDINNTELNKEFEAPLAIDGAPSFSFNVYVVLERRSSTSNALFALDSIDLWGITGKEEFPK